MAASVVGPLASIKLILIFCIYLRKRKLVMNKNRVIETLESLPDEFETEALIEKLLFIEKVEKGMKDVSEGKTISLQEAKNRFETKWSKEK
jgi:hypothetical protein